MKEPQCSAEQRRGEAGKRLTEGGRDAAQSVRIQEAGNWVTGHQRKGPETWHPGLVLGQKILPSKAEHQERAS